VLAVDGPLTGQAIADRIRRSRSRTGEHLRVLREKGLVKTDGPRNARDNTITPTGMELLRRAYLQLARQIMQNDA
jgi:DNA-binding MarR family transcriptional regulator